MSYLTSIVYSGKHFKESIVFAEGLSAFVINRTNELNV